MSGHAVTQASPAVFSVAICGCLVLTMAWGVTYSMPVLFPTLASQFGVPAWHLAACFSVGGFLFFSMGGLAGGLADRYGTHRVVGVGLVIAACGFLLASVATSEWLFACGYIIAVSAAVGACYAPVTGAVQVLTTPERRVAAAGITSAGIGFAAMLPPMLTAWVLQAGTWRLAMQTLAGMAILGILPVYRLAGASRQAAPPSDASPFSAHPNFAWAFTGQVLFAVMYLVPVTHLVNIALWRGWQATEGVTLISLLGVFSTIGRFLVTPFAKRLGACHTAALCTLLSATSMAGIALARFHWLIWGNVALFGLFYGAVIALSAPVVLEICGTSHIGRNVGLLMGGRGIGILVGPWSVGFSQYYLGSYTWPLLGSAMIGVAAACSMARSGQRPNLATADATSG